MSDSRAAAIKRHLKGRRVMDVDARAVNVLTLTLDNGKVLDLEVESMGNQIYGIVSCLCKDKSDHKPAKKQRASQR